MNGSLEDDLEQLRSASLFRSLRNIDSPQSTVLNHQGVDVLNFSSNDYLGLSNEPFIKAVAKEAIDAYGVGSGASRLICGNLPPHVRLERALAEFKRTEAALSFSSGYAAAVGTVGALVQAGDTVILDKLSHASLIDGARLSGATIRVFPHNNLRRLQELLELTAKKSAQGRVLIITESVFSMDGDCSPLREIVDLKVRYGAMLMVDEAHAVGVLGKNGRGWIDALGLGNQVDVQMGTLSKAIGTVGGYICGRKVLIDILVNRARSFIFSTAPAPGTAAAAAAVVEWLQTEEGASRISNLWTNLDLFVRLMGKEGWKPGSAILPLGIGAESMALEAASRFLE